MFISRQKFVKELESAHLRGFMEGLDKGYMRGRESSIFEKHTINEIREACGLPPMQNSKKEE